MTTLKPMHSKSKFTLRQPNYLDITRCRILYRQAYKNMKLIEPLSQKQTYAINAIETDGCVIFDSYIPEEKLKTMQLELNQALINLQFNTPCLAQNKIDPNIHEDLINNHMLATPQQLEEQGVTFDKSQAINYKQVLTDFHPSTLTVPMLEMSTTYQQIWTDPFILGIIAAYLGIVPKLTEAYVRRNFPANYRSMNHYWHRDINHNFHLLKMFVFLSDCTIETGPHEFIKGSHTNLKILNGQRYYQDAQINKIYPPSHENRVLSTVKAGTVIIENTQGLHRATIPKTAYRDLGFGVFMPIPPLYRHKNYHFPKDAYQALSAFQKAFIPKSFTN
jgi:hypothetical protein